MKNKKIVLVDMDGVLCDYDMKAALMPQWLKDKHYDCHGIPGFYRDLEPMPGALKAFDWLTNISMFISAHLRAGGILQAGLTKDYGSTTS